MKCPQKWENLSWSPVLDPLECTQGGSGLLSGGKKHHRNEQSNNIQLVVKAIPSHTPVHSRKPVSLSHLVASSNICSCEELGHRRDNKDNFIEKSFWIFFCFVLAFLSD